MWLGISYDLIPAALPLREYQTGEISPRVAPVECITQVFPFIDRSGAGAEQNGRLAFIHNLGGARAPNGVGTCVVELSLVGYSWVWEGRRWYVLSRGGWMSFWFVSVGIGGAP